MKRNVMMARLAEIMADDPRFGYSNKPPSGRWGPDFDCSSFLYFIAWLSGYPVGIGSGKVRFTGQMTKDFKDAGFELLPFANVGLGDLDIGDILLNLALHAEIYVGDGQVVGAQSAENGGYSGEPGDQTGTEIMKQPAYIYENDWDFVLRPPENSGKDDEEADTAGEGDELEMAYPYGNTTMGGGTWMPNSGMSNMPRTTMPMQNWMPPMQTYGGYPQGNVGQLNGYSSANAGGYQQPGQMAYGNQGTMGYPQGGNPRQLTHINELSEIRDIHVNPGECIPVFIGDGRYMALKSADQEGFPNVRVFEMTECSEEMPQYGWTPQEGMGSQQPRMQQSQGAVSREEFNQLKEMIGNVQSAISASGFPQGANATMGQPGQPNDAAANQQSNGRSSGQQSSGRNTRTS